MSLVELMVTLGILSLFMLGIVIVMRGIDATWRSAMVRVPLAATNSLVGQMMSDQLGQAHCIDTPHAGGGEGLELVGRVGPGCIDSAFLDEGIETFKFCLDLEANAVRYWRGAGTAPPGCSGTGFYLISNPLVEATRIKNEGGAFRAPFRRPTESPTQVEVRLHLKVPLPTGDERFWASGENERDWQDTFSAGAMPLRAP